MHGSSTTGSRPGVAPPTAPSRPAASDPAIDVARLRVAIARLSRRLRRHELAGLTPTQLSALATVERAGPLRLGDLAAAEGINPSYVSRVLRLTLLAPDIAEAILDGRQKASATLLKLMRPFAVEWTAQTVWLNGR